MIVVWVIINFKIYADAVKATIADRENTLISKMTTQIKTNSDAQINAPLAGNKDIQQEYSRFYEYLKIVNNNLNGTYNISLNKKIYTNEILNWLNYKNMNKGKFFVKKNSILKDSFTLNNYKLIDSINIKIKKSEVKKFCQNMGRIIYNKYNYSI